MTVWAAEPGARNETLFGEALSVPGVAGGVCVGCVVGVAVAVGAAVGVVPAVGVAVGTTGAVVGVTGVAVGAFVGEAVAEGDGLAIATLDELGTGTGTEEPLDDPPPPPQAAKVTATMPTDPNEKRDFISPH